MTKLAALLIAVPLAVSAQEPAPAPIPGEAAETAPIPPPQSRAAQPYPPAYPPSYPSPVVRPSKTRDTWYIGFGLGAGDGKVAFSDGTVSFADMNVSSSTSSGFLDFKVGATLSPRLLVGLDITGIAVTAEAGTVTSSVTVVNIDAVGTFFPAEKGLFLRGGLGRSVLTSTVADTEASVEGFNLLGGVGYAFWLGRTFNLTLNLDVSSQFYGSSDVAPERSTFWAGYVGFDWY